MGCYLSKPVTDKVCENFDKENIRVGTCSMQETVYNTNFIFSILGDILVWFSGGPLGRVGPKPCQTL